MFVFIFSVSPTQIVLTFLSLPGAAQPSNQNVHKYFSSLELAAQKGSLNLVNTKTLHFHGREEQWTGRKKKKKKRELFRPERFQTRSTVFGQCAAALVRHSVLTRPLTILKCHYGAIQQRVENLFSAKKRPSSKRKPALSETGQVTGTHFGQNRWKETLWDNWSNELVSPHLLNSSDHKTPQLLSNRNQKWDSTELGSHRGVRTRTTNLVPKKSTIISSPQKTATSSMNAANESIYRTTSQSGFVSIWDSQSQRWGFIRECNVSACSPLWAQQMSSATSSNGNGIRKAARLLRFQLKPLIIFPSKSYALFKTNKKKKPHKTNLTKIKIREASCYQLANWCLNKN